jgi:uncharacterized membrane protein
MVNADTKSYQSARLVSYVLTVLMFATAAGGWLAIPVGRPIAVHWDIFGQADGYAPNASALLLLPSLVLLLVWLFWRKSDTEAFRTKFEKVKVAACVALFGTLALLFEAQLLIIFTALGYTLPVIQTILGSLGILLAAIGAILASGTVGRNSTIGIRTPWSMKDDVNWSRTNRLGGVIMVLTGLGTTCGAACCSLLSLLAMLGGTATLLAATTAMSYYWSRTSGRSN